MQRRRYYKVVVKVDDATARHLRDDCARRRSVDPGKNPPTRILTWIKATLGAAAEHARGLELAGLEPTIACWDDGLLFTVTA